jgi:hypothetical protein
VSETTVPRRWRPHCPIEQVAAVRMPNRLAGDQQGRWHR